jgi:hypothetical protein
MAGNDTSPEGIAQRKAIEEDDVEGHGLRRAVPDETEGEGYARRAIEDEDVEGHGLRRAVPDETEGDSLRRRSETEDEDVEGHGMQMRSPSSHGE